MEKRNIGFFYILGIFAVIGCEGMPTDSGPVVVESQSKACTVSAPTGSIPVVLPDGSLGASPLSVVGNMLFSSGTIVVVLDGNPANNPALVEAAKERYGFYTPNQTYAGISLTAISANVYASLNANSITSGTSVTATGALYAGSASVDGTVKAAYLYSGSTLINGEIVAKSITTTQGGVKGSNTTAPEITVTCTVGVPCRCPSETSKVGQLETENESGSVSTKEIYCR